MKGINRYRIDKIRSDKSIASRKSFRYWSNPAPNFGMCPKVGNALQEIFEPKEVGDDDMFIITLNR